MQPGHGVRASLGIEPGLTGGNARHFVVGMPTYEDVIDDAELPWSLEFRSCAEQVARWSLFDDEPLTGLPDLHDAERNQAEALEKEHPEGSDTFDLAVPHSGPLHQVTARSNQPGNTRRITLALGNVRCLLGHR